MHFADLCKIPETMRQSHPIHHAPTSFYSSITLMLFMNMIFFSLFRTIEGGVGCNYFRLRGARNALPLWRNSRTVPPLGF